MHQFQGSMNPPPHEGGGTIGVYVPMIAAPSVASLAFLRFLSRLPMTATDALAALASCLAHDAVHRQVVDAHRCADLARQQSSLLAEASGHLPAGALRAAVEGSAILQGSLIDAWVETANAYGRAFARKVHAFPVAPVLSD
jgi:hypothetical protein